MTLNIQWSVGFCWWNVSRPKLLETPNYAQDLEGWIPYVLFNVYVPLHIFFDQVYLYFNNRPRPKNTLQKGYFSTSAKLQRTCQIVGWPQSLSSLYLKDLKTFFKKVEETVFSLLKKDWESFLQTFLENGFSHVPHTDTYSSLFLSNVCTECKYLHSCIPALLSEGKMSLCDR